MTYVGGKWLRTVGLFFSEWMFVLLLALTIIPFDLLRKLFIVPRLQKKRKRSRSSMTINANTGSNNSNDDDNNVHNEMDFV
jgi:hypothetical protein